MFNINDHLQELRVAIIGLVLMLSSLIIGVVWMSVGFYHGLEQWLGAVWGPIVLGCIFFLPIIIYSLVNTFGQSKMAAAPMSPSHRPNEDVLSNMASVFEHLKGHSPALVATVAIIAGFLAARFPALLAVFTQVLTAYLEEVKREAASSGAKSDSDRT